MRRGRQTSPPRHRAGFTLVELMVVISMIAIIMTMSATLFVALARAERNAVRSVAAQQTLATLNEQFRRDVHQAASVSRTPQGLLLESAESGAIRYQTSAGVLERIADTRGVEQRETYRLPETEWSMDISESEPRRVALQLRRQADTVSHTNPEFLPIQEWTIAAVLSLSPSPVTKGATP